MKPLESRSRALIEAARAAERPTAEDRARLRSRIAVTVAGAGLVATCATAAGAAAGKTIAGAAGAAGVAAGKTAISTASGGATIGAAATGGLVKAIALGAITGLAVVGAAAVYTPAPEASRSHEMPAVVVSSPAEVRATALPAAPEPPRPEPSAEPEAEPKVEHHPARPEARAEVRSSSAVDLREELDVLKEAQKAIRAGETDRALSLLDAHAGRFKSGSFTGERLAARAIALCEAGRALGARIAVAQFFAEAKDSLLEARVRAACSAVMSGEPNKK